jgi:hypothetical protein
LLHEYVHLWQQTVDFGQEPYKPGKSKVTHNKEWVEKCESLGLHVMPDIGCHVAVADEPFSILMKEWGVERPDDVPKDDRSMDWFKFLIKLKGKEVKGRSSLKKWTCPECGLNVRMGIVGDPMLRHHTCETAAGHPVFLIPGDVYEAKKNKPLHFRISVCNPTFFA